MKAETINIEVPVLVAERIVSTVTPDNCPWCADEFEVAGEHVPPREHKVLCPVRDLAAILDQRPRQ